MTPEKDWFDNDDFWEVMGPWMFSQERWEAVPAQVDGILELTKPKAGASVLDLCCGPGRHALELARRGFRVTGVDRSQKYLDRVRSTANEESLEIELVHSDMREFTRENAFDLIVNYFTSFGYFDDPEDDYIVLRNMHASLRQGGCLLIETMGKERLAKIFEERTFDKFDDGTILLEERTMTRDWTWIENVWTVIRNGNTKTYSLAHRIFTAAELKRLMSDCGFARTACFGSITGDPYDQHAKRLIVIGWK
ncbi:class I SAM-dependent methyltransferase [bacterium]|nr:class I SAM-dependent methyltransferase [bacterium]